ncbi:MAG: hypothetical protein C0511_00830 [Hyphomicrobium sp.]|nr:hypothetical protein [Hyphomicrobium sp.]PPC84033.1 MAG: hypothetical protein CTY40_00830 [Hyphomicrobium sp.]
MPHDHTETPIQIHPKRSLTDQWLGGLEFRFKHLLSLVVRSRARAEIVKKTSNNMILKEFVHKASGFETSREGPTADALH